VATPQSNIGDPFADIADLLSSGDDRTAVRTYARAQAVQRGLDPDFVDRLLNRESGYSRRALSNQGARGVGQMMPGTGKRYGLKDPFDAKQNVDASLSYIQDLQKRFKGDQRLMAAGYHAGEDDAEAALRNPKGNPKTNAYANAIAGDPFADIADLLEGGQPAPTQAQPKPTRPAGPFTQARARELGQANRPSEFNYQETKQREAERLRREQPSVSVLTGKPVTPRLQAQQSGIMRGKVKPGETPNQAFERALTPGPVSDIPKAIVQALTGVATDVGHLPATLLADLGALGGETPATRAMRGAMPATERAVAEALPLEKPESLLTSVAPGAIAGTAPYLMASQLLTVAGLGAATGAGGSLKESQAAGADKPTQYLAAVINAIGGATEALGAGGARARVKTGGGIVQAAKREGAQEFFQSGGQRVIQNLSALGYDPNREIDRGALDDAMLGLFVGSVVGGGVQGGADVAAARVKARQAADLINAQLKGEGDAEKIRVHEREVSGAGVKPEASEGKGGEDIHRAGPEQVGAVPEGEVTPTQEVQVKRTLQHEQFGEVQVESKRSDGKLVVTDTKGETHTIQNPRTQGNRSATFVRPRVTEEERQAAVERLRTPQTEREAESAKSEKARAATAEAQGLVALGPEDFGVTATQPLPPSSPKAIERSKQTHQEIVNKKFLGEPFPEEQPNVEPVLRPAERPRPVEEAKAASGEAARQAPETQVQGEAKAEAVAPPPEPTKVEKVKQAAKERIAERETGKARVSIRPKEYRGEQGFSISGRNTRGQSVRIFTADASKASAIADVIKAGKDEEIASILRSSSPTAQVSGREPITYEREAGRPFDKKNRFTAANYYDVTLGTEPNAPAVRIVRNSEKVSDFSVRPLEVSDKLGRRDTGGRGSDIISEVSEARARAAAENYLRKKAGAEPTIREASPEEVTRIEEAALKQKPNETGLTKVQRDYLAGELREIHSSGEAPATIRVPGDGEFTVGGARAAETLYKRVTGKPLEQAEGYGAKNKLVTSDKATEALDRIKTRRGTKDPSKKEFGSGGPSTEELADWLTIATYHIEAGAREFSDFVKRMVEDGGEQARAYAPILYERAMRYVQTGEKFDLTSAKNAITESERAIKGMAPVEKQLYTSMGTAYTEGRAKAESDPTYARTLAAEIVQKPRPLTATEVGSLSYDRMQLKNAHTVTKDEIARLVDEGKDPSSAHIKLAELEQLWDVNDQALQKGGREQSAAFNARKMVIRDNYDLLSVLKRVKVESGKPEVDAKLRAELEDLTKRYAEAESKIGTQEERIQKLEAELAFKRMERDSRKAKRAETKSELDDEFAKLKTQFTLARKENARISSSGFAAIDPEGKLTALVGKMALNRVKAGVTSIEGIVDDVYSALSDQLEGLTKRDVRDAISGYGRDPKRRTIDQMVKELAGLKVEMRKLSKGEDIASGKVEDPKTKTRRTQLLRDITDLQKRIQSGEYEKPGKTPTVYDTSITKLVRERDHLKYQIDRLVAKQNRSHPLDIVTSGRQSMMLGNLVGIAQDIVSTTGHNITATAQMLPAAISDAVQGMVTKQRVSTVLGPVELAKAITTGLKSVPGEAKEIAKHGLSAKQAAEQEVPHEINSGNKATDTIIAAVSRARSIADLPNWEVAFQIGKAESAKAMALTEAKQGKIQKSEVSKRAKEIADSMTLSEQLDVSMDAAAAVAKNEATVTARMRTFKQDNFFSDMVRKALSDKGGHEQPAPRFLVRLILPFDKAMSNYVKAGFDLTGAGVFTGLSRGLINMARAGKRTETEIREQQRKANLAFGRGVTGGSGGLLLGYTLAGLGVIGDPKDEENRRKGRSGSLHIGGKSFDLGWVGPLAVPLSIGAGFYYNQLEGAKTAGVQSIKQAPLVRGARELYNVTQVLESKDVGEAAGTVAGRIGASFIPGVLKDVARLTDTKDGEPVQREQKGLTAQFKAAIPGVRKTLPERMPKDETRKKAIEALRKDPNDTRMLDEQVNKGEMTQAQRADIIRDSRLSPFQLEFQNKDLAEKLKAFRDFTSEQKAQTRELLSKALKEKNRIPPAKLHRLRSEYPREMALQ
jgi:hypothetical protein